MAAIPFNSGNIKIRELTLSLLLMAVMFLSVSTFAQGLYSIDADPATARVIRFMFTILGNAN